MCGFLCLAVMIKRLCIRTSFWTWFWMVTRVVLPLVWQTTKEFISGSFGSFRPWKQLSGETPQRGSLLLPFTELLSQGKHCWNSIWQWWQGGGDVFHFLDSSPAIGSSLAFWSSVWFRWLVGNLQTGLWEPPTYLPTSRFGLHWKCSVGCTWTQDVDSVVQPLPSLKRQAGGWEFIGNSFHAPRKTDFTPNIGTSCSHTPWWSLIFPSIPPFDQNTTPRTMTMIPSIYRGGSTLL